jgi:hypothetical protein
MSHSVLTFFTVAAAEIGMAVFVGGFIRQLARVLDRIDSPPPTPPQEPSWWPSFERQFGAYVESLGP